MGTFQKIKTVATKRVLIIASILFSGICWYVSNGLNGDYWYLLWVAPIPILLISFNATAKQTFFISFFAYLIGRLSWFGYLITVATLIPAIIFTLALPLIFAFIIVLTRIMVVKTSSWYAVFAFPVFFTAFEELMIRFSPDGTAASIAYSQSNFLPLIQIASITGILGITFMVTFIPSALAMGWHFRKEKTKLLALIFTASILIVSVFLYGFNRINTIPITEKSTVGLVVLDEKMHKMGNLNFQNELEHTQNYISEISKLATQGAKLIVLPERAINVNKETDSATIEILSTCARQNHISIITGYTNFKNETAHNSALAIDEQGKIIMDYNKTHLVTVLEDEFVPGNKLGLFTFRNFQAGAAICKDLDFPEYIKQYGRNKVVFLCIPAWDFVVDDWLHSRMAILRGVENGFSEVRTARLGRLTISDAYGRLNAEANCSNGKSTNLVGQIALARIDTFYTQHEDWFGLLMIITTISFILLITIKSKNRQTTNH
jgi:apolipoprotein N-acyltransferase